MIIFFCTTTFRSFGNGPSKFAKLLMDLNNRADIELHIFSEDILKEDYHNSLIHKVEVRKSWLINKVGMISRISDYHNHLIPMIKQKKPDIIIFNNAILGIESYKGEIPTLGMINDNNSLDCSIKMYGLSHKFIRHWIFKKYEKKATQLANGIISNSDVLSSKLLSTYHLPEQKLFKLYKAVDEVTVFNTVSFKNIDTVDILFVKSDFIRGGLEELIDAANILSIPIELHIVGPQENDFNKIKKLNKNNKTVINLYGRLSQDEIYTLLRKVDVFCTPSREEALGVANMEAMIHKVPVVYTRVGGIPEVMDLGNNGFEAEANNPNSLASAISECINNEILRNEKIKKGYVFVKSNFTKKVMLENFTKICHEVIASTN